MLLKDSVTFHQPYSVNLFEVTIRVLGSLLRKPDTYNYVSVKLLLVPFYSTPVFLYINQSAIA